MTSCWRPEGRVDLSGFTASLPVCDLAGAGIDAPGYTDCEEDYCIGTALTSAAGFTKPFVRHLLAEPSGMATALHTFRMPVAGPVAAAPLAVFGVGLRPARIPLVHMAVRLPVLPARMATCSGAGRRVIWLAWALAPPPATAPMEEYDVVALAANIVIGRWSLHPDRGFPPASSSRLNKCLAQRPQPSERVVDANQPRALPSADLNCDGGQRRLADGPGSPPDTLGRSEQQLPGLVADSDIETAVAGAPGIWFIIFDREIEEQSALGVELCPAREPLARGIAAAEARSFGDLLAFNNIRQEAGAP